MELETPVLKACQVLALACRGLAVPAGFRREVCESLLETQNWGTFINNPTYASSPRSLQSCGWLVLVGRHLPGRRGAQGFS